jgi:hypothetical protein
VEKEIEEFKTKWSCKQCVKLARKRYDRFQCENLTDSYIKKSLNRGIFKAKARDVTPKLIQMKREQLLFTRALRKVKKCIP